MPLLRGWCSRSVSGLDSDRAHASTVPSLAGFCSSAPRAAPSRPARAATCIPTCPGAFAAPTGHRPFPSRSRASSFVRVVPPFVLPPRQDGVKIASGCLQGLTFPRRRVLRGVMTSDWPAAHRTLTRWGALLLPIVVGAVLGLLRDAMDPSTAAMVLVLAGRRSRRHGRPRRRRARGPRCRWQLRLLPHRAVLLALDPPPGRPRARRRARGRRARRDGDRAVGSAAAGRGPAPGGLHLRSDPPARPPRRHDGGRPGRSHRDRDHHGARRRPVHVGPRPPAAGTTLSSTRTVGSRRADDSCRWSGWACPPTATRPSSSGGARRSSATSA